MAIQRVVIDDIFVHHKVEVLEDFFRLGREGAGEAQRYLKPTITIQLDGFTMVLDVKITHFENV